jgi:hypothetical protein
MATAKQIEAARKALADGHGIGAAIDAAELAVWQPIETIPRDGTKILGTDGHDWAAISFYWYDADEDKIYYSLHHGDYVSSPPEFTHWRPLPAPPKKG